MVPLFGFSTTGDGAVDNSYKPTSSGHSGGLDYPVVPALNLPSDPVPVDNLPKLRVS